MKNRFLLGIALLITSGSAVGAEQYPERYKVVTGKNPPTINIIEVDPPEFSIGTCAVCHNEASSFCNDCQGVYYCSSACQTNHLEAHKDQCAKIKLAHRGDLDRIEDFWLENLKQSQKAKKREFLDNAFPWYYRMRIRLEQDIACYDGIDIGFSQADYNFINSVEAFQLLQQLVKDQVITQEELAEKLDKDFRNFDILQSSISWVEELTDNDQLVAPDGMIKRGMQLITQYYANKYPNNPQSTPAILIPQDQWKSRRKLMLKAVKEELQFRNEKRKKEEEQLEQLAHETREHKCKKRE